MITKSYPDILKILFFSLALVFNAYGFDEKAKERGELLFLNYCNGCHSLKYSSYPKVSMPPFEARRWFGLVPPDLSLTAKAKGGEWVRDYLRGFYPDSLRPFGTNNKILHDVQMPNVLAPLQDSNVRNQASYLQAVDDIVVFLEYVAEPNKQISYKIGLGVVGFLCLFLLLFTGFFAKNNSK
jgi:ubiquinol-cytochrome c reductase cytochrome c1 subunit